MFSKGGGRFAESMSMRFGSSSMQNLERIDIERSLLRF